MIIEKALLRQRIKVLEKALALYANPNHWRVFHCPCERETYVVFLRADTGYDFGPWGLARRTLGPLW